jgi:hypothetical protein
MLLSRHRDRNSATQADSDGQRRRQQANDAEADRIENRLKEIGDTRYQGKREMVGRRRERIGPCSLQHLDPADRDLAGQSSYIRPSTNWFY